MNNEITSQIFELPKSPNDPPKYLIVLFKDDKCIDYTVGFATENPYVGHFYWSSQMHSKIATDMFKEFLKQKEP